MNQLKHYTAKDIERYHSGQLSAAEMHALEKAALDDPFLADALEGYVHTSKPAADLSALQQKLQLRIEEDKKRKPLFNIGKNWMKIAALFFLFAGGGWLVFQTLSKNNKNDIATIETLNRKMTPVDTNSLADSTNILTAPGNSEAAKMQEQASGNLPAANDVTDNRQKASKKKKEAADLSTQGNAARGQEVTSMQELVVAAPESKENLPPDSVATTLARVSRQAPVMAKTHDTIRNVDVVLKPTEVARDEMVVMKNKAASPEARKRMQLQVDTLEPAEGWTNFDDYIANNLRTPEEIKSRPVKGEVELSFDVNKEGQPVNIAVVKSLCEKCDEEAIRLLKEGPKWKNNNKKGKVKIKF